MTTTRLPIWLKKGIIDTEETRFVRGILKKRKLFTVCDSARCPNKGECYAKKTATFLILGHACTRTCQFCAVEHDLTPSIDAEEPKNVALAVQELGLKYVVITSVTRDDLEDGGASHFADTITEIRSTTSNIAIEVLVPDFQGNKTAITTVLEAGIDVFNHNVETLKRLYSKARPQADYQQSLDVLQVAKSYKPTIITKTGIMVGLGESIPELVQLFDDLTSHSVDMLTIGQYIQPTKACLPVEKYYTEEEFVSLKALAEKAGIKNVISGPLVRSSYKAFDSFQDMR